MNSVLKHYIPVAKLIAETFGSDCEVVLHDLTVPEHSVVYTLNSGVTDRAVGQSFNHLIKEVLLSNEFRDDCVNNYPVTGVKNKKIKSSTALIRDIDNKVVGALCVNLDITACAALMEQLNGVCRTSDLIAEPVAVPAKETVEVVGNIKEIVDDIIDKTVGSHDPENMSRDEKIELVKFLSEKGVFLIKGSVDKVAEKMNISRVTVYSYLDSISKNSK